MNFGCWLDMGRVLSWFVCGRHSRDGERHSLANNVSESHRKAIFLG
jgi:hypothetical protein